jgi:hypothetical protein
MIIVAIIGILAAIFVPMLIDDTDDIVRQETYQTICLGGHEYYQAHFAGAAVLALKVDNKGKPIWCRIGDGNG